MGELHPDNEHCLVREPRLAWAPMQRAVLLSEDWFIGHLRLPVVPSFLFMN